MANTGILALWPGQVSHKKHGYEGPVLKRGGSISHGIRVYYCVTLQVGRQCEISQHRKLKN